MSSPMSLYCIDYNEPVDLYKKRYNLMKRNVPDMYIK